MYYFGYFIAATLPLVRNETVYIDDETDPSVADVSVVDPDTDKEDDGTDALDDDKWMSLPAGKDNKPYRVVVRPRKKCHEWRVERLSFQVVNARRYRVRIGDNFVTDWVSVGQFSIFKYLIKI